MRLLPIIYFISILLHSTAFAKQPSYDSMSFNYAPAQTELDITGYELSFIRSFNDSFFGEFEFASSTANAKHPRSLPYSDEDLALHVGAVSIGFRHPLSRSSDVYTQLRYAQINLSNSTSFDESINSYSGEVGIRSMITRKAELSAAITTTKSEDIGTDNSLQIRFEYYLFKHLSIGVQYINDIDFYSYGLLVRLDNLRWN